MIKRSRDGLKSSQREQVPQAQGQHTAGLQTFHRSRVARGRGRSQDVGGNEWPVQKSTLGDAVYENETEIR